jgi:hypothetical protein
MCKQLQQMEDFPVPSNPESTEFCKLLFQN